MLLRGTVRGWGLAMSISVLAAIAASSAAPQPTSAALYETEPPFCEGAVLHDYLAPLEQMPKLHSPPKTGQVGFAPGVRLVPNPSLLVGGGQVGYKLFRNLSKPTIHPNWDVTTTVVRVDWKGRPVKLADQLRRRVRSLGSGHGAAAGVEVSAKPAPYRLTVVFRSDTGKRLSAFGMYFRVVAPTSNTRLTLNAASYRPGSTVFGRIENFGTSTALYGEPYTIEKWDGSAWNRAPETPRVFILPLYGAPAGKAGDNCSPFNIPPTMPAGYYRMVKSVEHSHGWPGLPPGRRQAPLTAEFEVLP